MSLTIINNQNVSTAISDEYQEYQEVLIQFKDATSLTLKRSLYKRLKELASLMIGKLDKKCNGDNTTSLQQVCWMTIQNHEYNLTIPGQDAVTQEQLDMEAAMEKTVQPIWRPNTKYYVRFRLKDEVDNGEDEGIFDYYYGFKTVGPVGHYHKDPNVDYVPSDANADQYPLTSLRQYIDYNRSYPNADGSLLQAKPLFYGYNQCKISIYFSKPLAYHMLNKWPKYEDSNSSSFLPELAGNMHVAIKDPVTNVVIPYPLPSDFDQNLIPTGQTFATWLEVNWTEVVLPNDEEVELGAEISIKDSNGQSLGTFTILFSEYGSVTQRQHIRIDDEAVLSDNSDLINGKIQWNSNGTDVEYTILEVGQEDATWNVDNDPRIPANLQLLNNMIDHINENNSAIQCELKIGDPIVPNSYSYNLTLTNLKPSKLYTALIYNAFDKNNNGTLEDTESEQIHQFVFQTSRYENFEQQVNSYWLQEFDTNGDIINQRQAVFEIPLELTSSELDNAYSIVSGNLDTASSDLELRYYDLFDRAIEGVLGFIPVDPPNNTEFNLLKDTNSAKIIGLLIRNPEPFNIPKIPLEEIQGTIEVVSQGGSAYKVLYSKDYSHALIMHTSKEINVETLDIRFQYKTWNGSSYVISDTVVIEDVQITQ